MKQARLKNGVILDIEQSALFAMMRPPEAPGLAPVYTYQHELPDKLRIRQNVAQAKAGTMTVSVQGPTMLSVKELLTDDMSVSNTVTFEDNFHWSHDTLCTCGTPRILRVPCSHVLAAIAAPAVSVRLLSHSLAQSSNLSSFGNYCVCHCVA